METFIVRYRGEEIARVGGEGIVPAQKCQFKAGTYDTETVEDLRLLSLRKDGKTVLVFYVSSSDEVSIEKVST